MQHQHYKHSSIKKIVAVAALLLGQQALAQVTPGLPPVPVPQAVAVPHVYTGNAETRDLPFLAWHRPADLKRRGYLEEEVLVSGMANAYEYIDELGQQAAVQPTVAEPADYTTRMLIRRPQNPEDFNGVIYLEILNATARYDGAPMWNLTWRSIVEDGAIWAGVTYSDTTAGFMRDAWGTSRFPSPSGSAPRNRSRYANLNIPNRSYTWDIVNQAAALMRQQGLEDNPLREFPVQAIIVTGYSQSAGYVTTHANSFAPASCVTGCETVVDGHIVAAPGPTARKLDGAGSHPLGDRRNCDLSVNREAPCIESAVEPEPTFTNLNTTKLVRFTTESDIKSVRVRQADADQPLQRTYEVAGSSHVDFYGQVVGGGVAKYQFGFERSGGFGDVCALPLNPLSTGIPLSAIQHRLARWILNDEAPPPSSFIEFEGDFDDGTEAWVRDSDGNVIGGVRPPRIEVPLGTYLGSSRYDGPLPSTNEIFCTGIVGGFNAFDSSELASRYGDSATLRAATFWNMLRSAEEGFLLRVDARTIRRRTQQIEFLPD